MKRLISTLKRMLPPKASSATGISLLTAGAVSWAEHLPPGFQVIATHDHEDLDVALDHAQQSHVAFWRGMDAPEPALLQGLLRQARSAPVLLSSGEQGPLVRLLPAAIARALKPRIRPGADLLLWQAAVARYGVTQRTTPSRWTTVPRRTVNDPGPWLDTVAVLLHDGEMTAGAEEAADVLARSAEGDAARYAALLAGIRARGIPTAFTRALNQRLSRSLVLAYCFLPHVDPSAIVMAKRIGEMDLPVDVISNRLARAVPADASLMPLLGEKVGHHIQLGTRPKLESWATVEAFAAEAFNVAVRLEVEKGPYTAYYSRAQWPASHFAAALCKLRNPRAEWTAEFSDPLLMTSRGRPRAARLDRRWLTRHGVAGAFTACGLAVPDDDRLFFWAEALPALLADRLIFTNANQLACMLHYQPMEALRTLMQRKAQITPQPRPPASFFEARHPKYELEPGVINIGYFGSFYKVRGLGEVVSAMAALPDTIRRQIRLHIFTEQPAKVKQLDAYKAVAASVRLNAFVGYLDFLALLRRFDYLLVNDALSQHRGCDNPYRPSKLSDYMGSGQPVWAVCEENSPLAQEALPPGSIKTRMGQVQALSATLQEMVARRAGASG